MKFPFIGASGIHLKHRFKSVNVTKKDNQSKKKKKNNQKFEDESFETLSKLVIELKQTEIMDYIISII